LTLDIENLRDKIEDKLLLFLSKLRVVVLSDWYFNLLLTGSKNILTILIEDVVVLEYFLTSFSFR
jgi:hypothetical protein